MKVMRAKVLRTRPRFNMWKLTFTAMYDESQLDLPTISQSIESAGAYVGLCDSRPKYGKFTYMPVTRYSLQRLPLHVTKHFL